MQNNKSEVRTKQLVFENIKIFLNHWKETSQNYFIVYFQNYFNTNLFQFCNFIIYNDVF